LRTAKQLEEEAARIAAEAKSPSPEPDGDRPDPTVTVHRDASGRIVDVAKMKEEERLAELEEKRKEREREEWSKGFVQRQQREARAKEEAEMRQQDVGR
jgi:pre-mRNA-splicing factor CWC26